MSLYHDYRTGGVIRDALVFPCDAHPFECSCSPDYFSINSEHVTLQGDTYSLRDNRIYREPLTGWDSAALHPWERDLVTNDEPFAHPSRGVQS